MPVVVVFVLWVVDVVGVLKLWVTVGVSVVVETLVICDDVEVLVLWVIVVVSKVVDAVVTVLVEIIEIFVMLVTPKRIEKQEWNTVWTI